ncbi:MAG: phosphate uptake regulator PhoU, partial [Methanotrichaceae archaeon]|nr:phosphate uptake regulator PhoU [Methanotrichaceae archaeon]
METRKVQKTGTSTLIVSLPKKWANENVISNGSLLFISQNQNGDLLLSIDKYEQDQIVKLDIGSKSGDTLIREVIACYIAGYRTIEISSHQLTAMQKRDLHSIVNKLIGPEILEETINKVVIQDLLGTEELQADSALKRIKNMTRSMIQDALSTLIENNKELAIDVIQRDNDVDRLNLLITRQFIEVLRSESIKQETLNPIIAFNYMQAATNFERMADHASRIAEISSQNDYELPAEMTVELSSLSSVFTTLIDESISILLKPDTQKANQLIDRTNEIKKQSIIKISSFWEMNDDEMQIRLVVANSMERIFDHIINIAELVINMHNAI